MFIYFSLKKKDLFRYLMLSVYWVCKKHLRLRSLFMVIHKVAVRFEKKITILVSFKRQNKPKCNLFKISFYFLLDKYRNSVEFSIRGTQDNIQIKFTNDEKPKHWVIPPPQKGVYVHGTLFILFYKEKGCSLWLFS